MALNDVYQVSVNQTLYGVVVVNTFTFRELEAGPAGIADILQLFDTQILADWAAAVGTNLLIGCLAGRNLTNPAEAPDERLTLTASAGTRVGEELSANTVAVLSLYTGLPTKKGRGRKFISGLLEVDEEDNCWDVTSMNLLTALIGKFTDDLGAPAGPNGHYVSVIAGGDPLTDNEIVTGRVNSQVRKHRSRTTKRGCGV